jgi:hypothetical protein
MYLIIPNHELGSILEKIAAQKTLH